MSISEHILTRLKVQHLGIPIYIEGLNETQLHQEPFPGKWSIHNQIAHLGSYQIAFLARLEKILKEDNPGFGRYRAEDDPNFATWQAKANNDMIHQLFEERNELYLQITQVEDANLARTGTHPLYGKLTVPLLTEFFLLHEAHHLYAIFSMAQGLKG